MKCKVSWVLLLVLLLPLTARAEDLKVQQWLGREFVFLDLPAEKRASGYDVYSATCKEEEMQKGTAKRISFAEHYGKHVTITGIKPAVHNKEQVYFVTMTELETNMKLLACTFRDQLDGLLLFDDYQRSRWRFIGKPVYVKTTAVAQYNQPGFVNIAYGQSVTVENVALGYLDSKPLLIIAKLGDVRVVVPIAFSWTNQEANTWKPTPPWQDDISLTPVSQK